MAGKTLVLKGYSSYTNIPARHGDHDNGLKTPANPKVVETKTIEGARGAYGGYTNSYGSPTKFELLREYVYSPNGVSTSAYAPRSHYDNKPNYVLNYDNLNPLVKNNPPTLTKQLLSSTVHKETQKIHSEPGLATAAHVGTYNVSGPPTIPPLHTTSPKKVVSEPSAYLTESMNHPLGLDTRRRGVFDDLSTSARPIEPRGQYQLSIAKPNNVHYNLGNTRSNY